MTTQAIRGRLSRTPAKQHPLRFRLKPPHGLGIPSISRRVKREFDSIVSLIGDESAASRSIWICLFFIMFFDPVGYRFIFLQQIMQQLTPGCSNLEKLLPRG